MPVAKIVPSGIEPKQDFDAEILCKAQEIGELIQAKLKSALLDLSQQESFALERLREYTPTDRLLTLKEAAAYLGYKPRTLNAWCSGKMPLIQFRKLGGELRFRKIWLDQVIDNGSIKPRNVVKL